MNVETGDCVLGFFDAHCRSVCFSGFSLFHHPE